MSWTVSRVQVAAVAAVVWMGTAVSFAQVCPVVGTQEVLNNNAALDLGGDFRPQLATDGLGNWVVVWGSLDDLNLTIGADRDILVARSSDDGATWSDPQALNTNAPADTGADLRPQISTDGNGVWIAVWNSNEDLGGIGTDHDIFYARSTNNGLNWSAPQALNTNANVDIGTDGPVQLTTDQGGVWVAVWESDENLGGVINNDLDILFARSTNGGVSWTAPAALNSNATTDLGTDFQVQVTTNGSGTWIALWASDENLGGTAGSDTDILFSRSINGGVSWGTVALLNANAATDTGEDFASQLTTDGSGWWIAVWESGEPLDPTDLDDDIFYARSFNNGLTWSLPAPLNANALTDDGNDRNPQLTTDGMGRWIALWQSDANIQLGFTEDTDDDVDVIYAQSLDNGATWTPEISDCCWDNLTFGCDDAICEAAVCAVDPLCCTLGWDADCAEATFGLCEICTPPDSLQVMNSTGNDDSGDDVAPQLTTDGLGHWVSVWHSFEDFGETLGEDADLMTARFELSPDDCNANGTPDSCDVLNGTSDDCNANGMPDECENVNPIIVDQPDSMAVCEGEPASFSVAANGSGIVSYSWRKGGTPIPGATGSTYSIPAVVPADAGSYDVQVTDDCATVLSNTATLTINMNPTPLISADPGSSICVGATVMLDAGSGYASYLWMPGGQTTQTINVAAGGIYSVEVEDANGCMGGDEITVTFGECPGELLCDPGDGVCKECLGAADCFDGDQCTSDLCTGGSCSNPLSPGSTPCDNDGDLCTIDECNGAGQCLYVGDVVCGGAVPPCEAGTVCNPASGNCDALPDAPAGTPCEADGDGCTVDECNGSGQCLYDSDLVCAGNATCTGGMCTPDNDICTTAIGIGLGLTTGSTEGGAVDGDAPSPCGTFVTSPGVWYSVTGTGNTMTASTCGPLFDFDTKIGIYSGSCGALECITGSNDSCSGGASQFLTTVEWCSELGVNYLVLLHANAGETGLFELEIADGAACELCVLDTDCGAGEICVDGNCEPEPICGVPGSGDCFDLGGTGSAGCEDETCCLTVCSDPAFEFCCDAGSGWDASCATQAFLLCEINGDLCAPTDLNDDGITNAADLAALLGAWGTNPAHPADFNSDGVVNAADLAQLLGAWGPVPDCDDGDPCTIDGCDPATGGCLNDPIECPPGEVCVGGICVPE